MNPSPPKGKGPPPTWVIVVASLAIVYYFAGIAVATLNVPSGPWPGEGGRATAGDPPRFASDSADLTTVPGKYLRVAHSFQFDSNHPGMVTNCEFEVRLKDADGHVTRTLKFPDADANPWVRHRQELMARYLAQDIPVPPQAGDEVAVEGKVPTTAIWLMQDEDVYKPANAMAAPKNLNGPAHLETVPNHLIPRTRDVWQPSPWATVLAKSYCRYLCRENGAASAELVRKSRGAVGPAVLFGHKVAPNDANNPYSRAFDVFVASFGEVKK